jgi:transcription elongation factor Elf1
MTGADAEAGERADDGRSEMVVLPAVVCPRCNNRNVVAQIQVEQTPVLSCTACGHSSRRVD